MHLASFIFEKRPTDRKDGEKIAIFDGTLFRTSEGWGKYSAEGHPASTLSETFRHRDLPLQTEHLSSSSRVLAVPDPRNHRRSFNSVSDRESLKQSRDLPKDNTMACVSNLPVVGTHRGASAFGARRRNARVANSTKHARLVSTGSKFVCGGVGVVDRDAVTAEATAASQYVAATWAETKSPMRHCIVDTRGVHFMYQFSENKPDGFRLAAFEAAGVCVYMSRLAKKLEVAVVPEKEEAVATTETVPEPVESVAEPVPEVAPPAPPSPVLEPEMPSAQDITSKPPMASYGENAGKSGAAVFERGGGIASWHGWTEGYEVDLVLEVDVPVEGSTDPIAVGVSSVSRGRQALKSGAAVFGDGVGTVTFSEAELQTPAPAPGTEAPQKPMLTVGEARSVSSGGVAFEGGAGVGGARWNSPKEAEAASDEPAAGAADSAQERKVDVQTVVVWGLCAAIFAYKIFFARV